MIQESWYETQKSDTLPLWALQPRSNFVPTRPGPPRSPVAGPEVARPKSDTLPDRQPDKDRILLRFVAIFAVLNVADLITTFVGLHSGLHEGNPLMSALLAKYGFIALVLYKVIVIAAVAQGVRMLRSFRHSVASATIVICDLLVLIVVIANVAQYLIKA